MTTLDEMYPLKDSHEVNEYWQKTSLLLEDYRRLVYKYTYITTSNHSVYRLNLVDESLLPNDTHDKSSLLYYGKGVDSKDVQKVLPLLNIEYQPMELAYFISLNTMGDKLRLNDIFISSNNELYAPASLLSSLEAYTFTQPESSLFIPINIGNSIREEPALDDIRITPMSTIEKNTREYYEDKLAQMKLIIIAFLIMIFGGLSGAQLMNFYESRTEYALFFITGLQWKDLIIVHFLKYLVMVILSIGVSFVIISIQNVSTQFSEYLINGKTFLLCLLFNMIILSISFLPVLARHHKVSPRELFRRL